jgi:inositol-phosphate phosphatase/L-galactose 1-phosphate phosphatase/histidinol-phosphatase
MSSSVLPEFIDFAHELADAAGNFIRPLFRTCFDIDSKSDESPVTIADRGAEQLMRDMIMARYPDHGIWGEEFGKHQADAKYCWVLDPVDGTMSFISGFPTFGILISLIRLEIPILGLIDQPINKERWLGVNPTSFLNGTPIKTRPCTSLSKSLISTTSPYLFNDKDKAKFELIRKASKHVVYGYDCYAYAQLASGFIDAVIETGLKPHDYCALRPVIENAGGIITDWQGAPLTLTSSGHVVAAGDKALHAEILKLLVA